MYLIFNKSIFSFNLLRALEEIVDYEWLVDIGIVAIPTMIVCITSFFSVHLWQIKKEQFELKQKKYALRKEIQNDFQESIVAQINLCRRFVMDMTEPYVVSYEYLDKKGTKEIPKEKSLVNSSEEKEDEDGLRKIVFQAQFPEDEKDFPQNKMKEKMTEFREKLERNTDLIWNLFSTLTVYYQSNEIKKTYHEITDNLEKIESICKALYFSKKREDFMEYKDDFHILQKREVKLSSKLIRLLVDTPLKELKD